VPSHTTNAVDVFVKMVEAARAGVTMTPRSANDKEYFFQDWFSARLTDLGLPFEQQGRNSYPDYWVGSAPVEGFEVKSLGFVNRRPARKDIDFNSTIPSGRKQGRDVFLVFALYTGGGANSRHAQSLSVAHGDLINSDHALADEHLNVAVHDFGSYADGFIRNRKMYVFNHPITIDPEGLGKFRLIVPQTWAIADARLKTIKTIGRVVAKEAVDSYTIRLHGRGQAEVMKVPYQNAGTEFVFDVFGMADEI
jgi:hypothetical protein